MTPSNSLASGAFLGGASTLPSPFHASVNVPATGPCVKSPLSVFASFESVPLNVGSPGSALDGEGDRLLNRNGRQDEAPGVHLGKRCRAFPLVGRSRDEIDVDPQVLALDAHRPFPVPGAGGPWSGLCRRRPPSAHQKCRQGQPDRCELSHKSSLVLSLNARGAGDQWFFALVGPCGEMICTVDIAGPVETEQQRPERGVQEED